jgi:hypothetical protein
VQLSRVRGYIFLLRKSIKIKYSGSTCVDLGYPVCNAHALYCHLGPVRPYNILLLYAVNSRVLEKKILNINMCFDFSTNFSEIFYIPRKLSEIWKNVKCFYCKVAVMFVIFEWKLNFMDRFSKNIQILILTKNCPLEAVGFHTDRTTDGYRLRS